MCNVGQEPWVKDTVQQPAYLISHAEEDGPLGRGA